jgi:hypothetical protein
MNVSDLPRYRGKQQPIQCSTNHLVAARYSWVVCQATSPSCGCLPHADEVKHTAASQKLTLCIVPAACVSPWLCPAG